MNKSTPELMKELQEIWKIQNSKQDKWKSQTELLKNQIQREKVARVKRHAMFKERKNKADLSTETRETEHKWMISFTSWKKLTGGIGLCRWKETIQMGSKWKSCG